MKENEDNNEASERGGSASGRAFEHDRPDIKVREAGSDQAFGMACHLATLITYCFRLAWFNIPGVIAPILLWQLLESRHKPAVYHAKEAFNFQLNILAWSLIAWVLNPVCCVGYWLGIAVTIANVVFTIVAAISAADGERYRYPGIVRVLGN